MTQQALAAWQHVERRPAWRAVTRTGSAPPSSLRKLAALHRALARGNGAAVELEGRHGQQRGEGAGEHAQRPEHEERHRIDALAR